MQNDKSGIVIIKVTLTLLFLALFAIGQPAFSGLATNKQITIAREKLWVIRNAMINFSNDFGFMPSETTQLENLTNRNSISLSKRQIRKYWQGPYIDNSLAKINKDPWNTAIKIVQFQKTLFLQSAGPDRQFTPVRNLIEYSVYYDNFVDHDDILVRIGDIKMRNTI